MRVCAEKGVGAAVVAEIRNLTSPTWSFLRYSIVHYSIWLAPIPGKLCDVGCQAVIRRF